jgi:hypothetical protein
VALPQMQQGGSNPFVAWHILHQYSDPSIAQQLKNRWQNEPPNSRAGALNQGHRASSAALWLTNSIFDERLPASLVPSGGGSPAGYRYHAIVTMTDLALGTQAQRTISVDSPNSLTLAEAAEAFATVVASTYSGSHQSEARQPTAGTYLFDSFELYAVERTNQ